MKIQISHTGRIKNGKMIFDIPDLYSQQLLELEGKTFVMVIKEQHKKPTLSQYGYYRGCILPVCYESEYFQHMDKKDDIHEDYFAPRFLSYKKTVDVGGDMTEQTKIRSLSELSKEEMSVFLERVLAACAEEFDINIPPPETFYSKYYNEKNKS